MAAMSDDEAPTPIPRRAYTVDEFAEANGISRASVYKLWREGKGPRYKIIGKSKRIITAAAADEWDRTGEVA
jgi:hypothetical protein